MIFGSFLSNIDMQSGSPTLRHAGVRRSGLLCTGQIARHFGLPFRTGGGLTSSQVPDAQAGYEALMTLLPTFLAGANWVMHSAGWLEGGLVAGYEKFIIDVELLQMLQDEFTPLEIDEALAGLRRPPGGRPRRPLPRRRCTRWSGSAPASTGRCCRRRRTTSAGCATAAKDTAARAGEIYQKKLEEYEQPAARRRDRAELEEYVVRRRAELGD